MSEVIAIEVEQRNESLNPRQVRAEGLLPGTVYGKGMDSCSIQLNKRDFINVYKNNKDATFGFKCGQKNIKAIVKNLQVEARTQKEMNVEFLAV